MRIRCGCEAGDVGRVCVILDVLVGASWQPLAGGCSENAAARWCRRFEVHGLAGLADRPRSGYPQLYMAARRRQVIEPGRMPPYPTQDGTAT
jgi:hypothetical protein